MISVGNQLPSLPRIAQMITGGHGRGGLTLRPTVRVNMEKWPKNTRGLTGPLPGASAYLCLSLSPPLACLPFLGLSSSFLTY